MKPLDYTVIAMFSATMSSLVGATAPLAKCMRILSERIGLTPAECRAIGRDNALSLLNSA